LPVALKPPDIERIAEAVRDQEWLDIRAIDEGRLIRVMPVNITVWPDRDDVTFRQEYIADGDYRSNEWVIDAEDIMALHPSIHGVTDVERPRVADTGLLPEDAVMCRHAIETVAFVYKMDTSTLLQLVGGATPLVRYFAIMLMWETTGLSQTEICAVVGYKSPQPYYSARLAMKDADTLARLRQMYSLMEERVGRTLPYRRNNGTSVLS
jgi:hypothetical protein